jgi:hypothetical protein
MWNEILDRKRVQTKGKIGEDEHYERHSKEQLEKYARNMY